MKDRDKTKLQLVEEVRELRQRLAQTEVRSGDQPYDRVTSELRERVKELDCLHGLARIALEKKYEGIEALGQEAVELLPPAWQFPESTAARIVWREHTFVAGDWSETPWRLSADLLVRGTKVGIVEVAYTEEFAEADEGPFLREERALIDTVAKRLGHIIERYQAEAALRESEQRLSTLMGNLPGIAYRCTNDGDWSVEFVSDACEAFLGYKPGQLRGNAASYQELIDPEDRGRIAGAVQTAVENKQPYRLEYRVRTADGKQKWVRDEGRPVLDDRGRGVALEGLVTDISDRKRAVKALRESRRMLSATGKMARIGGWEHDLTTGRATWTQGLYDIIGIPCDEEPPGVDEHLDFYPPEDREVLEQAYERAVREGVAFDLELRVYTASRKLLWCHVQGEPILREGKCIGLRGVFQDITERKRTEEALRKSEEQYRLLADNTLDVIWTLNLALEFTYVNPAIQRLTGYTPEDFIGSHLSEHCDEPHFAQMAEIVGQELAKGPSQSGVVFETVMHRKDGSRIPVEIHGKVVFDEAGAPSMLQGTTRDLTERKKAERALRASEARKGLHARVLATLNRANEWRELLRDLLVEVKEFTGFDAVGIRLREDGDYPYYEHNGFPTDFVAKEQSLCMRDDENEIVRGPDGTPLLECMCGNVIQGRTDPALPFFTEEGSFWTNSTTQLLSGTTEAERQACTRNRCNKVGYESVALIPLRAGDETIGLLQLNDHRPDRLGPDLVHFFEEVAHSIGIAFTRRQAEEKIESLARFPSENPSPVMRVSEEGYLLEANPAALAAFPEWDLSTDESVPPELLGPAGVAVGQAEQHVFQVRYGERTYSFYAVPVADGGYVNLYGRDTTEQARLEEQLRQSQKMEAIGKLAGGVAHDFNNMLTIITGHCDLMKRRLRRDTPIAAGLAEIRKAADRAAGLTRQLLAFSRRQTLDPKILNLNDVVGNLEKMLRRLIGEDIDLKTVLTDDIWHVKADPGQIEQVLMNLVVNARDAMPDGGKLTIETVNVALDADYARSHADAAPGPHVMLAVSDTGCGMDEETRAQIFDPFFTTKEVGEGTGLGLSTVYGIVKQSGGDICVYSEEGEGTTFKIYLPRAEGAVWSGKHEKKQAPRGGGEHVLIVEDEDAVRELMELVLSDVGYKVTAAANGDEALLLVEERGLAPDVLVTDVVMPGMSGKILAGRLQRDLPALKVLYVSGYTDSGIVHRGILDEGTPFLQKPFDMAALAERVRDLIEDR